MTPDIESNAASPLRPSIEVAAPVDHEPPLLFRGKERLQSSSSIDSLKKDISTGGVAVETNVVLKEEDEKDDAGETTEPRRPGKTGTIVLLALAVLILSWWVSSLVVPIARDRWMLQTAWAWFFVLIIVFRFVPATVVSRPISAAWNAVISRPVASIPPRGHLALCWLGAFAITSGSTFGFRREEGTSMTDRIISLVGIYFFQLVICGNSVNRKAINWFRIPISIILQQSLAIFVLKTSIGFFMFSWINGAVSNIQSSAVGAIVFVFDQDVTTKNWLFVSELTGAVFLSALVYLFFWLNWMQWLTMHFAWLGQRVFGASGAETFVGLWSPWFGQVYSAILVAPYVESMTDTELYTVMATSMSSISSLMINSYITKLALPARSLVAQSAVIIPAAIMNAKVAFPEADTDRPLTRSRESTKAATKMISLKSVNPIESLNEGALVGLKVAGSVLINFFSILSVLFFFNGIFIWIFVGFGVRQLDSNLIVAGLFYPMLFFTGVPRHEIFNLAYVLSTKILVSPDFAYARLAKAMAGPTPFSPRGFAVIIHALANSATVGSIGIQLGVMYVLAKSRGTTIARGIIPALSIAVMTTMQTAAIAANIL